MNIQVTNVIAPAAPKSIEDTGLNVVMMRDILLKTIFRMNLELVSDISRTIAMPIPITQELIENAAKFSLQRDSIVDIELLHFDRLFAFNVRNMASAAVAREFEQHIQTLLMTQDLDSMYVDILEKRRDNESRSGIGLLLLMKDHGLKLGVRFSEDAAGKTTISVRAFYFLGDE